MKIVPRPKVRTRLRLGVVLALVQGLLLMHAPFSQAQPIPDWVMSPFSDGLTATGCTPWSGSINIDRMAAMAMARTELAQQIEISVNAVDKVIATKRGAEVTNIFESISEQTTSQVLQGARATRVERVTFDGVEQLCAQVEVGEEASKELFSTVLNEAPVEMTAEDEAELYSAFLAAS